MPSNALYTIASNFGISKKDIERYWDKAKELTMDAFGYKSDSDFNKEDNKGWKYAMGIIKQMIGSTKESILKDFLESKKSAKEFVETIVSNSFDIGNVIPPEEFDLEQDTYDLIDDILDQIENESEYTEQRDNSTAKCPDCGGDYLVNSGYCVSCKKKVSKKESD